jgi:hypothetical protein
MDRGVRHRILHVCMLFDGKHKCGFVIQIRAGRHLSVTETSGIPQHHTTGGTTMDNDIKEGLNENHEIIRSDKRADDYFQSKANDLKPVLLVCKTPRKYHPGALA